MKAIAVAPGARKLETIDLPRPRDGSEIRLAPRFIELHGAIWHAMKDEVLKGYARQQRQS